MAHFDDLVQKWKNTWQDNLAKKTTEIEKQGALTSVKSFEEFAKELNNPEVKESYNNVIRYMYELDSPKYLALAKMFHNWADTNVLEIDHKEFSRMATRLRIIYQGLLELGKERIAVPRNKTPDLFRAEYHSNQRQKRNTEKLDNEGKPIFKGKGDALNDQDLKKATESVRRLYIIAISLRNLPKPLRQSQGTYIEVINNVADFVENTSQLKWDAIKNKHVDWINGKAEMDIQISSNQFNTQWKGLNEYNLGIDLNKILNNTQTQFLKYYNKTDWGKLEGSLKLEDELEKQAVQLAKGKKPKAKKSKTRKSATTKKKTKKVNTRHTKKLKKRKKLVNIKPRGAVSRVSKDVNEKQKTTAQITSYINRGLHKKLQQEMGRPALRYQSGTFARNVKLQQLTLNNNNQLVGKYTYQLYPYQTFENTGRWPAGYNPKPLITKSIRELAERHTSQKIVNLRRV